MLFSLYFLLPLVERVRSSSFSDVSAWLLPNKPSSGGRGKKRNQNQNRNLVLRKGMLQGNLAQLINRVLENTAQAEVGFRLLSGPS